MAKAISEGELRARELDISDDEAGITVANRWRILGKSPEKPQGTEVIGRPPNPVPFEAWPRVHGNNPAQQEFTTASSCPNETVITLDTEPGATTRSAGQSHYVPTSLLREILYGSQIDPAELARVRDLGHASCPSLFTGSTKDTESIAGYDLGRRLESNDLTVQGVSPTEVAQPDVGAILSSETENDPHFTHISAETRHKIRMSKHGLYDVLDALSGMRSWFWNEETGMARVEAPSVPCHMSQPVERSWQRHRHQPSSADQGKNGPDFLKHPELSLHPPPALIDRTNLVASPSTRSSTTVTGMPDRRRETALGELDQDCNAVSALANTLTASSLIKNDENDVDATSIGDSSETDGCEGDYFSDYTPDFPYMSDTHLFMQHKAHALKELIQRFASWPQPTTQASGGQDASDPNSTTTYREKISESRSKRARDSGGKDS